jgi:hypothetical protein
MTESHVSALSLIFRWEDQEGTPNNCISFDIGDERGAYLFRVIGHRRYSGFLFEWLPF